MTSVNHLLDLYKYHLSLKCDHITVHFWLGNSEWITGSQVPNSSWNQPGLGHPIPLIFPSGKQNFYSPRHTWSAEAFVTDLELVLCSQLSQWFFKFGFLSLSSRCCEKKSCGNRNETPSDPVIIDR